MGASTCSSARRSRQPDEPAETPWSVLSQDDEPVLSRHGRPALACDEPRSAGRDDDESDVGCRRDAALLEEVEIPVLDWSGEGVDGVGRPDRHAGLGKRLRERLVGQNRPVTRECLDRRHDRRAGRGDLLHAPPELPSRAEHSHGNRSRDGTAPGPMWHGGREVPLLTQRRRRDEQDEPHTVAGGQQHAENEPGRHQLLPERWATPGCERHEDCRHQDHGDVQGVPQVNPRPELGASGRRLVAEDPDDSRRGCSSRPR